MSLRYIIESILFLCAMLIFQTQVSAFNKDLHISIVEVKIYVDLKAEILSRGGTLYESHSSDSHHLRDLGGGSSDLHSGEIYEDLKKMLETVKHGGKVDFSVFTLPKLIEKQKHLHDEMVHEFHLVIVELEFIRYFSLIIFLFPVAIFCKRLYSKLTNTSFVITAANLTDLCIVCLTAWMWETMFVYEGDIKRELFNEVEDKGYEVRFMANVCYDVIDDDFHFDFLMATITAFLWFRVIVLLKLTETFGPLVVMIYRMTLIIIQFFVLLIVGLITFASIATMTLSEIDAFKDMY